MEIDLEWNDHYLIGVEEIDVQHKMLLKIMRQVFSLKDQEASSPELKKTLRELKKYAQFHFKSEEMLMELYSYPKYEDQKTEHKLINAKLKTMMEQVKTENDISELLYFLIEWFVGHTRDKDRIMGIFINKNRSE
ncbi:MAG: hemerythrin family protein [Proteobacteria bacterium]|nr:hemerythrin family protein [Pseudomonadota bacterium]MBU1716068.1 hemerythrin family protein [Pseudomonadota bacterium]